MFLTEPENIWGVGFLKGEFGWNSELFRVSERVGVLNKTAICFGFPILEKLFKINQKLFQVSNQGLKSNAKLFRVSGLREA